MRFVGAGKPLRLVDLPDPLPQPGWVVLNVEAAGLCHSDVHVMRGAAWIARTPMTLGHEVAGTIAKVGKGVSGFQTGDRVGVALISHPPEVGRRYAIGIAFDGGFAEQAIAHVSTLVPIPEKVSFAEAAVATDSVATAYHAVRTAANARPGQVVGVIGLGGLGLNGVRTASLCGSIVYGVDINPATFKAAKKMGARECFADVAKLSDLKPEIIIDFAGASSTTAAAIEAVRPGGRVVLVGLAKEATTFRTHGLISNRVELVGSLGASKDELRQVYDFIAAGAIKPMVEEVPFLKLNEALQRLGEGGVVGRLFARPRGGRGARKKPARRA